MNEFHKRLLRDPEAICLQRYVPKDVFRATSNTSKDVINIQKYDFIENKWNEFRSISLDATHERFGSILLNGQFYVIGGHGPNDTTIKNVSF